MLISTKFSVHRTGQFVEIQHADQSEPVMRFSPEDDLITAARAHGAVQEVIDTSGLPRHGHYPLDYCVREEVVVCCRTGRQRSDVVQALDLVEHGILHRMLAVEDIACSPGENRQACAVYVQNCT